MIITAIIETNNIYAMLYYNNGVNGNTSAYKIIIYENFNVTQKITTSGSARGSRKSYKTKKIKLNDTEKENLKNILFIKNNSNKISNSAELLPILMFDIHYANGLRAGCRYGDEYFWELMTLLKIHF